MSQAARSQIGVWIARIFGVTFVLVGVARFWVFPATSWPLAVTILTIAVGVGLVFLLNVARNVAWVIAVLYVLAIIVSLTHTDLTGKPVIGIRIVYGLLAWSIAACVSLWLPITRAACRPLWRRSK